MMNMKKTALLLILLLATITQASITYVDATFENTSVNGESLQKGINYIDNGTGDDDNNGLWGLRHRKGVNGGYLWNCDRSNDEETEPLITTMTIKGEPGEYSIYGFFMNSQKGKNNWDCAFSIDGGESFTIFTKDNASSAESVDFTGSVCVADATEECSLLRANIGTITTTKANQSIKIYVQGLSRGLFNGKIWMDDRSWYEGVGYAKGYAMPVENSITMNKKETGYRGVWYMSGPVKDEYAYKYYSGGLGTYCAKHRPFAIYSPEANKTFFCYGGSRAEDDRKLVHMVSYFDHSTGMVPRPTLILDKETNDAHDNPVISMDDKGYIWIFSTAHGTIGSSYIHKSREPYNIDTFDLVRATVQTPEKVMPFTNFSYFQPWPVKSGGFECFMTLYHQPVIRTIYYLKSKDGISWDMPVCLSKMGKGSYQTSFANDKKAATAFNYHPPVKGIGNRTNIYYIESTDSGENWTNAAGEKLNMPLEDPYGPALVYECESKGRNVYVKDLCFDSDNNPIILFLTSGGSQVGPQNNPRNWTVAYWTGTDWQVNEAFVSDNNYDTGAMHIEGDCWRIIAPTAVGPQAYNPGGEMMVWESVNKGKTWNPVRQLTVNSPRNHSYARVPLNAESAFYAMWADGDGRKPSMSNFYFCDEYGNVYALPREMKNDFEKPG